MPRRPEFEQPRPVGWAIRLDPQERELLHTLAKLNGLNASAFFRSFMRAEARRLGLDLPKIPAASPAA